MDSKGRYYDEETLRREVIEPELERENRAERRKREAIKRAAAKRLPDKAEHDIALGKPSAITGSSVMSLTKGHTNEGC